MKKLLLTILMVCLIGGKVCAQHWDIHTLQTINNWKVHGLSRGLSDSGLLLPVGIPTAMGIYALIKKDQPLLKDAVYIGTSVIEAVGITYGLKYAFNRQRPYLKYPDRRKNMKILDCTPPLQRIHPSKDEISYIPR